MKMTLRYTTRYSLTQTVPPSGSPMNYEDSSAEAGALVREVEAPTAVMVTATAIGVTMSVVTLSRPL